MKVGRTALLLVPLAVLSRGVAFLVPVVVARWFGVGPVTDAWFWALSFPTFALVLASTAVGTASLPALARASVESPERVGEIAGSLMAWAGLVSLGVGVLFGLALPMALPHLTAFDADTVRLATGLLRALVPFMALTCAGAVLRVTAEVQGRFQAVAVTPVLRAAVVIGAMGALRGPLGPYALPAGLFIGEVAQVLYWGWLGWQGGVRLRFGLGLDSTVRQVGRDLAPILGGEVLVALNLVIDKGFAAMLPSGSVATLEYADRARVIPQTVLESSLLMVSFATWSNLRAGGRFREARESMDAALRWTLALAAPPLAGMYIGRFILVRLMFERGAFGPEDTAASASVLGWFIPGILPNLLGILAVRAHVVERNLRLVFGMGVVSVLLNTVGDAVLIGPLGLSGLALATTLNNLVVSGVYVLALRPAWSGRSWLGPLAVAGASIGVAAAVELRWGAPTSLLDPHLWAATVACCALLALGVATTGLRPRAAVEA